MQPSDRNNAGNLLSKHSPQKVNKPCMPKATINQRNITSAKQRHVIKNNHPILRHQKQFALAQWCGNQEVVSFHISSANNQTKAPPQRQGMGQSTHTAALQLAQRTVVNIIKTESPTRETSIAAPTLGSSHDSHHPRGSTIKKIKGLH
jgi:hypothetical protein